MLFLRKHSDFVIWKIFSFFESTTASHSLSSAPSDTMKIALQYLNDSNGKTHAVQLTLHDWEKLMNKLKKYEQALRLQSDLADAFDEVTAMRQNKKPKQSLSKFLNEL